jgi:hypothetical protein
MRCWRVVSVITLLPLSCGPFSSRRDPLQHAAAPLHGDFPYSIEERESISRNRRVLAEIAAALAGQRRWPDYFSPSRALWWLAESRRSEYLPLFLRYSEDINLPRVVLPLAHVYTACYTAPLHAVISKGSTGIA